MWGLHDPWIWGAYFACLLSVLFCCVYGMVNWNKGIDKTYPEDIKWEEDEEKLEKELE